MSNQLGFKSGAFDTNLKMFLVVNDGIHIHNRIMVRNYWWTVAMRLPHVEMNGDYFKQKWASKCCSIGLGRVDDTQEEEKGWKS